LFEPGKPDAKPTPRAVPALQARRAQLRVESLNAPAVQLNLFDNADRIVQRTSLEQQGPNRFVWHGSTEDGGIVTFGIADGVATGSVFLEGRSFEITADADGEYTIEELNPALFPDEEVPLEPEHDAEAGFEGDRTSPTAPAPSEPASPEADTSSTEIGVMVLWTPAARSAQGGTSSIQSLVLAAVANANLAYSKSGITPRLKLVHSAELSFAETSSISTDLAALKSKSDGKADGLHTLRDKYGADVVSLIGQGYVSKGTCGIGYQMSFVSTAFAASAFNIVDRTCAVSNLSFAHEVGHNQGLAHDPGHAGIAGAYSYAYGYQDPGGLFRTVMSYGSGTRIPYFSNPSVYYSGRVTGKSSQNNAKALNNAGATVAQFRASTGSVTCSYSVSPTSLSFGAASGSAKVNVTASSGCSWTSSSSSSWAKVTGSGSGSGSATVTVTSNGTTARSASLTVAGKTVSVSQSGSSSTTCSYTISPTSLTFTKTGGTATIKVTTGTGCSWTTSGSTTWAKVSGAGTGSGSATVQVFSSTSSSRSATLKVAGKSVSVSQASGLLTRGT
jgi:hypothetical protein